jgi:hypothetical protein
MPATPVIPEEQECDAIEDALEKDMNHYLIFLANAPISAAAAMTISLLQSGLTVPDARTPIEDTWAMGSS